MNNQPLLSIVIPTKNRYETLFCVVDIILGFNKNEDIEIIIQDNSDDNTEALKFIQERKSVANLKYFYESEKLSVIENSDKAVLNSTGEYVCFIGDDDGVMPYIVDVARWMRSNRYHILKSRQSTYFWPNQKMAYLSNNTSGVLTFLRPVYKKEIIKTDKGLQNTLNTGGTSINMLPCLYHGIVSKTMLNRVYEKCGTYFPGPSPDMANAVALALVSEEYIYVHFPVVISGKSAHSTGGQGVIHKHVSEIKNVPHLPCNTDIEWSEQIPKYWTGSTIYAESVIKSIQKCGHPEYISDFNFSYLYARLFIYNYKHRKLIFRKFPLKFNIQFFLNLIKVLSYRVYSICFYWSSYKRITNLKTIGEAISFFENYLDIEDIEIFMHNN